MRATGTLQIALIGAGRMGQRQCRTWQAMPDVAVVAVVDPDLGKAQAIAPLGAKIYRRVEDLSGGIDAAIIAAPSQQHLACAHQILAAGIPCLIEKPMALTAADCQALLATAHRHGVKLAVGHCERFNPVLLQAHQRLKIAPPRQIKISRLATIARSLPEDVVFDLMVHDLDWCLHAFGAPPHQITVQVAHVQNGLLAEVACDLQFADGPMVSLHASRIASAPLRRMVITPDHDQGDCLPVSLDLLPLSSPDPLTLQARAFLDLLQAKPSRIATGADGLAVVALAERIAQACRAFTHRQLGEAS